MFFTRKKKLLQDRNAGLVFQWRGGNAGNRGGMTLALILSGLFFMVAFASFDIIAKSKQPPPRYTANITLLGEVDENMTWWIEKNSPYQRRWYKEIESLGEESVSEKLGLLLDSQVIEPLGWRKYEGQDVNPEIPSVYAKGEVELPPLSRIRSASQNATTEADVPKLAQGSVELGIGNVDPSNVRRLPDKKVYQAQLSGASARLGETLQYMVNLNAKGEVLNVTPLKWSDEEVWKELEIWINGIKFKPSEKLTDVVLIEVGVRPKFIEPVAEEATP